MIRICLGDWCDSHQSSFLFLFSRYMAPVAFLRWFIICHELTRCNRFQMNCEAKSQPWTYRRQVNPQSLVSFVTERVEDELTHWGGVTHICVSKLYHHWLRSWLVKFVRRYGVLHSMLRNLMSLFIKIFPHIILLIFLPFYSPHHQQPWWLRWELGIVNRSYCQGQTHRFIQLIENRVREKGEMLSFRETCLADVLLHFNSVGMIMRVLGMSAVHVLPRKKSAYLFDFSSYIPYEFFSHCILKLLYEASFFMCDIQQAFLADFFLLKSSKKVKNNSRPISVRPN